MGSLLISSIITSSSLSTAESRDEVKLANVSPREEYVQIEYRVVLGSGGLQLNGLAVPGLTASSEIASCEPVVPIREEVCISSKVEIFTSVLYVQMLCALL